MNGIQRRKSHCPQHMCQVDEMIDRSFFRTKTMWWSVDSDSETHQGEHKPKIT